VNRIKVVTVRVIPPAPFKAQTHRIKAHPGYHYEDSHVDDLLSIVADRVEQQFSKWEFRLVQLGPDKFNFVFSGEKEKKDVNQASASVQVPQDSPSVEDHHDPEGK
jgi:hypothetical protein